MIPSCLIWMWKWQLMFLSKCHQAVILKSLLKWYIFWKSQMLCWPKYQSRFLLFVCFCTLEIQELTEDFHEIFICKRLPFLLTYGEKMDEKLRAGFIKHLSGPVAPQLLIPAALHCGPAVGASPRLTTVLQSGLPHPTDVECKASEVKTCPAPHSPKLVPTFQRLSSSPSTSLVCTSMTLQQQPNSHVLPLSYWNPRKMRYWEVQQVSITHGNMSYLKFS